MPAKDYEHAGELLLPHAGAWEAPEEGLLVYDRESQSVVSLGEGFETEVPNFGAKLYLLYPQRKGWAIIGRSDKYLPAAAVELGEVSDERISFALLESGPLMVWSKNGAPKMEGLTFESLGNSLYRAE